MYASIVSTENQNCVKLSVRIWKSYGFERIFHCQKTRSSFDFKSKYY